MQSLQSVVLGTGASQGQSFSSSADLSPPSPHVPYKSTDLFDMELEEVSMNYKSKNLQTSENG